MATKKLSADDCKIIEIVLAEQRRYAECCGRRYVVEHSRDPLWTLEEAEVELARVTEELQAEKGEFEIYELIPVRQCS
jgi:hypothetical protein